MVGDSPEALKGAIEFPKMKKIHSVIGDSDGVFEVMLPSGRQLGLGGFETLLADAVQTAEAPVDPIIESVRRMGGTQQFSDDATVLEVVLR